VLEAFHDPNLFERLLFGAGGIIFLLAGFGWIFCRGLFPKFDVRVWPAECDNVAILVGSAVYMLLGLTFLLRGIL
jgi:hypothetical protein